MNQSEFDSWQVPCQRSRLFHFTRNNTVTEFTSLSPLWTSYLVVNTGLITIYRRMMPSTHVLVRSCAVFLLCIALAESGDQELDRHGVRQPTKCEGKGKYSVVCYTYTGSGTDTAVCRWFPIDNEWSMVTLATSGYMCALKSFGLHTCGC